LVALPAAGYNYNSDWTPLLAGLSPARMAASLAAPTPFHRLTSVYLAAAQESVVGHISDMLARGPDVSFREGSGHRHICMDIPSL
jgi:hypothetical protein